MPRGLTPDAALERLKTLYAEAISTGARALRAFIAEGRPPTPDERRRMCYPLLHVEHRGVSPGTPAGRAYAKFQEIGDYSTSITQPQALSTYLREQLTLLVEDYDARIDVTPGDQEIPYPFLLDGADDALLGAASALELAQAFATPRLNVVSDDIADGLAIDRRPRPLALFDAPRVDYSLKRLVHYTGTDWRDAQPWILFTNYHRYVDVFVRWAAEQVAAGGRYTELRAAGGVSIHADDRMSTEAASARVASATWARHQMPAYHLKARDGHGITLVNIGVGPSNAKTITDHLAVLRPHCWLMIGHCGGLRQSQRIGDYVLAHAYLREDHVLDDVVPPRIPIPALAEVQQALQQAAADVTGESGADLKARLRTGTVVTEDDRNWELRWRQEQRVFNLSRAIAIDMESGTIAAQGYRFRVPYGTLLCVSDKPLHGEIKLPGAANAFYAKAISQHLAIGIAAIERLQSNVLNLHSRKLRSFDEPPFR